jgi:hypothetical protein
MIPPDIRGSEMADLNYPPMGNVMRPRQLTVNISAGHTGYHIPDIMITPSDKTWYAVKLG